MSPLRLASLLLVASTAVPLLAQAPTTPEAQREFLMSARVVESRPAGRGVTGSFRLTLSDGSFTHDAGFQSIEERTSTADRVRGRKRAGELNFVDSYLYNIAAYEISRLVGLDHMMPVTVERKWNRRVGALTWWVDDVLMDETERDRTKTQPPNALEFARQHQKMNVFAELVRDVDRNKGNVLYTKDWRIIMIDFTRAFRVDRSLRNPDTLTQCDRNVYAKLQALSEQTLRSAVSQWLTADEIAGVAHRRALIVERYARLISARGEAAVLY